MMRIGKSPRRAFLSKTLRCRNRVFVSRRTVVAALSLAVDQQSRRKSVSNEAKADIEVRELTEQELNAVVGGDGPPSTAGDGNGRVYLRWSGWPDGSSGAQRQ